MVPEVCAHEWPSRIGSQSWSGLCSLLAQLAAPVSVWFAWSLSLPACFPTFSDLACCPAEKAALVAIPTSCGNASRWRCQVDVPEQAVIGALAACGFLWFALWLYLIYRGKSALYGRPYVEYKLANLTIRLQVDTQSCNPQPWTLAVPFLILQMASFRYTCSQS